MKKALSLGLASLLAIGLFAGCKAPADDSGSGGSSKTQTLTVYALESAYGTNIWTQIARAFEKANEGVTVKVTTSK